MYFHIVILEETCDGSGIYASLFWDLSREMPDSKFYHIDLGNQFATHGSMDKLYAHYGLDGQSIAKFLLEVLKVEN